VLKPHLHVEPTSNGKVFLVGEHERFMLQGRLHALVAPLIDGRRSEQQILEALAHEASAPEVLYSLFTLERQGYVVEVRPGLALEEAAFWYELGTDAARTAERLEATPVAGLVAILGPLSQASAAASARSSVFPVPDRGSRAGQ
jgi:hypothetical protein